MSLTASQRAWTAEDTRRYVEECLDGMRAVYQPIVELASGRPVAFEALARPPADSKFESPGPLFVAAKRVGLHAQLDLACRRAAVRGAGEAELPAGTGLFVNVEPDVLVATPPSGVAELFTSIPVPNGITPVLEITERALTDHTPALLAALEVARENGRAIAVDDVGSNPDALALLPLLRPDIVRLDGSLVQAPPGRRAGFVAAAVQEYAERSGALILAECIENETHLEHALALGATLGQGWMFGRPGAIGDVGQIGKPLEPVTRADATLTTPFGIARELGLTVRTGAKQVLRNITRHLEADALADPARPTVLTVFAHPARLTGAAAFRHGELARRCAFVAAFGNGMQDLAIPKVCGMSTDADDPLAHEWAVLVAGPRCGAALVAQAKGDDEFEYVVTHRPDVVQRLAESLMQRVVASARAGHVS